MKTIKMTGQSDDIMGVTVDGEQRGSCEYTPKRVFIVLPDGREIVATMDYNGGWEFAVTIPDDVSFRVEEYDYDPDDTYGDRGQDWRSVK